MAEEIVYGLELAGILVVIGWGFGLAAALAWTSMRRAPSHWSMGFRVVGVALALVVALSTSYGYALVLDAADVIHYCDPLLHISDVC